jgi:excinuclease ABC subunit A
MQNATHADDLQYPAPTSTADGFVRVRGARENNLRNVDVDVPRDAIVAFTGVSGSGKSSLAFGTIYAEAQRRYFESVAPYARRLIQQGHNPKVELITGLPPAVALQQRRGAPSSRSTVGTVTTLSNSLRMLFSRAGTYPSGSTNWTRTPSRPTPLPVHAGNATAWASHTPLPNRPWFRTRH